MIIADMLGGKKTKFAVLIIVILLIIAFFVLRNVALRQPDGTATLAWNANPETDLSGYKIYYGTAPRKSDCPAGAGYAETVSAGNKTSYTIEKLIPGSTYYFSVTSLNTSGKESCFSAEMKKTISLTMVGRLQQLAHWLHLQ